MFPAAMEFITNLGSIATFEGAWDVYVLCLRFRKPVVFYVRHPSKTIALYL